MAGALRRACAGELSAAAGTAVIDDLAGAVRYGASMVWLPPMRVWLCLSAALLGPAVSRANVDLECFAAATAMSEGRWEEAARIISLRLVDPRCALAETDLKYSLAFTWEQEASTRQRRACEIRDLYRAVIIAADPGPMRDDAERREGAIASLCPPPAPPSPPQRIEAVAPGSLAAPVSVSVGSAALVAGGVVALALAIDADARREKLGREIEGTYSTGDDLYGAWEDAASDARFRETLGWSLVAAGAVAAGVAGWLWADRPPAVAFTPAGAVFVGRF